MASIPRPPAIDSAGFATELQAWIQATGWSKYRLAELTGISRKQLQRWSTSEDRQSPTGKAADAWKAFRAGVLARQLREQRKALDVRIRELEKISWEGGLT